MDDQGKSVSENDSKGFKVKVKLTRPDMCIVMDEVGSNLSMMKDGHAGGEKFVVGKGKEAKLRSTKRDKRFTCLGLTLLSGEPLMCVIIVDSKQEDLLVRTGVDYSCQEVQESSSNENQDEYDYLINNLGKGKQYPGGPSCFYEGKEIPCMVEFTPGGSMSGEILTKIFTTIDELRSRKKGLRPFVLLDGHGSRFNVKFLEYITDDSHKWSVCIGVPYGTSLWQVGNSTEQNGVFKVRLTSFKQKIMDSRYEKMMGIELIPSDIIPIVNYAWMGSFENQKNNKKAIFERRWNPLNRMLLLHPKLRSDMTEKDVEWEIGCGLFSNITYNSHSNIFNKKKTRKSTTDTPTCRTTPTTTAAAATTKNINNNIESKINEQQLNFGSGLSHHFLKKIVKSIDFENARENIIADKERGQCLNARLQKMPKITAATLINAGQTHVLGVSVKEYVQDNVNIKREEKNHKLQDEKEATRKVRKEADDALIKNRGKPITKWTVADLKAVVKPEKTKNDGKMPSKKGELVDLYRTCIERQGRILVDDMPNFTYVQEEIPETAGDGESEAINDSTQKEI
jgi:hypothetical protein